MPRPRKNEVIKGQYFTWVLRRRNGVWQADGRGNRPVAGRHSLDTKDRRLALDRLRELDLVRAVDLGLADRSLLKQATAALVPLDEGRRKYLEYVSRPAVAGGATPRTVRRYEAIFDKFIAFASALKIGYWQQVDKVVIQTYGR